MLTDSPMSTFSSIQYFNGDMHLWASSTFNGNGKKVIYDTVMQPPQQSSSPPVVANSSSPIPTTTDEAVPVSR